jgi:hypothetical protein
MAAPETNDPPIVITGGSVSLDFDDTTLPGSSGKHSNGGKKIKHVTVKKGDTVVYDENIPDGKVVVTVTYGNGNP